MAVQKVKATENPKAAEKKTTAAKPVAAKSAPKAAEKSVAKPAEKPAAKPAKDVKPAKTAKAKEDVKSAKAKEPAKTAKATKPAKPAPKAADNAPDMVYHISKRKEDRKWQVKAEGAAKALKLFWTQEEAIDYAKSVAGNQEGRIVIHKEDGTFRKLKY